MPSSSWGPFRATRARRNPSAIMHGCPADGFHSCDVEVVAEVGDAQALHRVVGETRPDAVIVDIRMPPSFTDEGLVAAQRIRDEHPDVGVLVLSQYVEAEFAVRLLGSHLPRAGYLLKPARPAAPPRPARRSHRANMRC